MLVEVFYGGDSVARAARQLGIPHGTARSRLHYALQALRGQLDAHEAAAAENGCLLADATAAAAGGAAGPFAARLPARRVTAMLLLAAAALDLTRCGLVAATVRQAGKPSCRCRPALPPPR